MRSTFPLLAFSCLAAAVGLAAAEPLPERTRTFLNEHCLDCHDAATAKGKVNLEFEQADWAKPDFSSLMERVHEALSKGEMPPKKKPRPEAADAQAMLAWLDDGLVNKAQHRGTALRRLSRTEYVNTIRQTFSMPFEAPPGLPEDTISHGFDNIAETLVVSPPLLEAYAESAALIADQVFPAPRGPLPPSQRYHVLPRDLSQRDFFGPQSLLVGDMMRLAIKGFRGASSATTFQAKASGIYRIKVKASAFRPEEGQPMTLDILSGRYGAERVLKSFPVTGTAPVEFEFEEPIYEGQSVATAFGDSPNVVMRPDVGEKGREQLRTRFARHPRLLAACLAMHDEVIDEEGKPALKLRIPVGRDKYNIDSAGVEAMEAAMSRTDVDPGKATPEAAERLIDHLLSPVSKSSMTLHIRLYLQGWTRELYREGPAIDIHSMEIEGPLAPAEDDQDRLAKDYRRRLHGVRTAAQDDAAWLEASVTQMLRTLFRREVTAGETKSYLAIIAEHRASGRSLDEAMHLALRTALISPHFLYRETADSRFDAFDLATRLSYLLTSRPPDKLLFAAASEGSLTNIETLRAHALRLLEARDAEFFVKDFCGQWLGTRLLPSIMPDPALGAFDYVYLNGMTKEIEMFVATLIRENRPLTDFIDPDFTFTNPTIGTQIYGLPMPKPNFQNKGTMTRIGLPKGGRLGGLLGMCGVMMVTANGVDTHPVVRGKWVLENILGDPPPPPPDSVPALTPDTRGAKTIRDRLAAHTTQESCAACHKKLDPLGFVLENFDAIGHWRDTYPVRAVTPEGKTVMQSGLRIDATATLPGGTALKDVTDLKKYIVAHIDQFAGCLAEKIFVYGAGRLPDYAERKALHAAANRVLINQEGFRDLILAVIETDAFRTR
jgi:hypothetical protein